ncbi:hypothetical protein [Clostridium sp. B9]|uniref:ParM/StbA family protein n=1 Tax=Clostridium sp. B9 TaxID=3423224 RepID=UPI003D2F0528
MRNPNRIKKIMSEIEQLWEKNSDWRFGQLLSNIDFGNGKDIFYIEDNVLEEKLKESKKKFGIESDILKIGIDTGFGYGVSYWGEENKLTVPSVIKEITKKEALEQSKEIREENIRNGKELIIKYTEKTGEEDKIIEIERYFYVGDITLEKDSKAKRVLTTKRVGNIKHLVQILSLIGVATDEEEIEVNLSMGLPVKMKGEANALKKWLIGEYKIAFLNRGKDIERKITIDKVVVLPQALAPVFSLEEKDYIGKMIVSADLGHYTNDMCLWTGKGTDKEYDYCGDGFYECYNEMRKILLNDTNIMEVTTTIREKDIQEALENGRVNLINGKNEVEFHREKVLKDYAIRVVEDIITMYETIFDDMDFLLLSGGIIENKDCVKMIIEEIEKYKIRILMPEEPQYAVAKGLYNYLVRVLESKK